MTMRDTRLTLHRVAVHVLARRRFEVSGRFGLRATPGGLGTPAFGPEPEVLRVSAGTLVHETGGTVDLVPITGSSLRELALAVGADLDAPFSAGSDTPETGELDAPLALDPGEAGVLASWWDLGWRVLDAVLGELGAGAEPATIQLWPEHFDAGTSCRLPTGTKLNLGFSPGDAFCEQPYAYVGPWGAERPGDPGYWNAPFGAVLGRDAAGAAGDAFSTCHEFIGSGIRHLSEGTPS